MIGQGGMIAPNHCLCKVSVKGQTLLCCCGVRLWKDKSCKQACQLTNELTEYVHMVADILNSVAIFTLMHNNPNHI